MDGTKKKEVLQWHPAFFAGIQIEFEGERGNLIFENEHQLSKKPLEIDVLVIKKNKDVPIFKNIGRIFRKYNIVEYKSPDDYLGIDDFYKVLGYAYFYKADAERMDEIKIEEITVTYVCHKYPGKLIRHLRESRDDEIMQYGDGIYQVKGEKIPIQIIVTPKLTADENLWLRYLGNPIEDTKVTQKLAGIYKGNRKDNLYEAVMDMIIRTNRDKFEEETGMCRALIELAEETMGKTLEELLEEKVQNELEEKVRERLEEKVQERLEEKVRERLEEKVQERLEEKVQERLEEKWAEMLPKAEEKLKIEVEAKVKAEMKGEVKSEAKAETVLEFLEDSGEVSEELRMQILGERNFETLKRWIKLAVNADSVEAFQLAM